MNTTVQPLLAHLEAHRQDVRNLLMQAIAGGGLTEEAYARFLSFQSHQTRGVQRHFYAVAGHDALARRRSLRDFLVRFALEEEPHWQVAEADLRQLGHALITPPVEVDLWWAYFDRAIVEQPFVRLGATAMLENLGGGMPSMQSGVLDRPFLRPETTRFYELHRHEDHPHGEQVLAALHAVNPTAQEWQDLVCGAEVARRLHLGSLRWALLGDAGDLASGA